jgi:serine/threonine protein kinase
LKISPAFFKHAFYEEKDLKQAADLILRCLKWLPSERIKPNEAINHPFFIR